MSLRPVHLAFVVVSFASAFLAAAGCGSFGSAPAEADGSAAVDAGTMSAEAGGGEAGEGGATTRFCDGKSYVICSDFEGVGILTGGWDSADSTNELEITDSPLGAAGHALRVKVPTLPDGANESKALRKELPLPASLTYSAKLVMGIDAVSEYTELLSIEIPAPVSLQVTLEMLDGDLVLTEFSERPNGSTPNPTLLEIGKLTRTAQLGLEVRFWFGPPNEIEVVVDGAVKLPRSPLMTASMDQLTGNVIFSAGYPYVKGATGKNGGGVYIDDITLQKTP